MPFPPAGLAGGVRGPRLDRHLPLYCRRSKLPKQSPWMGLPTGAFFSRRRMRRWAVCTMTQFLSRSSQGRPVPHMPPVSGHKTADEGNHRCWRAPAGASPWRSSVAVVRNPLRLPASMVAQGRVSCRLPTQVRDLCQRQPPLRRHGRVAVCRRFPLPGQVRH